MKTWIYRIDIPLSRSIPVRASTSISDSRQILRIVQTDEEICRYWADCSPLPGLHAEGLDACLEAAVASFGSSQNLALPVSLRSALEILKWQKDVSSPHFPQSRLFENSALLTIPDRPDWNQALFSVKDARVCKVKVRSDLRTALPFLEALAAQRPDRELRIDCNHALSDSTPESVSESIAGLPVAYVEEPWSDVGRLKAFAAQVPLALDESLGLDPELDALARAWIIKPNVLGWNRTLELFAHSGPQQKILSNCFESLETLAFYAGVYGRCVAFPEACGLGTAWYMADEAEGWDPKVFQASWPEAWLAPPRLRGDLVWHD